MQNPQNPFSYSFATPERPQKLNNYHYNPNTSFKDPSTFERRLKTQPHVSFKDIGVQMTQLQKGVVGSTSYNDEFNRKHDQNIVRALNPEMVNFSEPKYVRLEQKFQGQSRYKTDYRDDECMKKIRQANRIKPIYAVPSKHSVPIKVSSTYKDTYKPYSIKYRDSKITTKKPLSVKFVQSSSYKDDYKGFTIIEEVRSCPLEKMNIPRINTTGHTHLYYDARSKSFV